VQQEGGGDEDDDRENCEDRDAELVAGNEIKNIREEEEELQVASENTLDDEDIREDEIKNISKKEQKFEDASEDALDDEDIGEDQVKSKDPNEWRSMPENGGNETLSRTMKKNA
jgi:hypothetical protein